VKLQQWDLKVTSKMSILLIDFESTGLDTKTARITEIGAMVVDDKFNEPTQLLTQLVWDVGYPAITDEVTKVTGITQDMLLQDSIAPADAFNKLGELVSDDLQYVIAYNRVYDENLLRYEAARMTATMLPKINWLLSTPWICAMVDLEANHKFKSWRLMHIALEHGVTVNPKELHRAINDVELMRKMLQASGTTAQEMYAYQQSPWVYVAAITKAPWEDNGVSTTHAKAAGFSWQQAKGDDTNRVFDKRWVKRIKQKDFDELLINPNLNVRLI